MSSSSHLPHDVEIEILEKLPVKSLIRFRCVCKLWLSTIENPRFARSQLDHWRKSGNQFGHEVIFIQNCDIDSNKFYSVDASTGHVRTLHPPIEIERQLQRMTGHSLILQDIVVCSCDGLLLLKHSLLRTLFLWNPTTNKFKEIQIPPPLSRPKSGVLSVYGFGYDSSIQDYKIIVINILDGNQNEVLVFTLNTNSWITIQSFPSCFKILSEKITVSICGTVHFLGLHQELREEMIFCFNLTEESFTSLPLPPNCQRACYRLNVVGNHLHIHHRNYTNWRRRRNELEVWSMTEYGNKNSWNLIMTHPIPSHDISSQMVNGHPLAVKDCHLHLIGRDDAGRKLIQENYKIYPIDMHDSMLSYVESLVCP